MKLLAILILIITSSSFVLGQNEAPPKKANTRPANAQNQSEPFDGASRAEMRKCVTFNTTKGIIVLEMFPTTAPETVRNFLNLTAIKAYDGSFFNRIVPGFVIQGGNLFAVKGVDRKLLERSTRKIPDEPNIVKHTRGILSMARGEEPNSASSDFFILLRAASTLDEKFAAFGRVSEGMDVVEVINRMPVEDEIPKEPVAILTTSIGDCVVKPEDSTKIDDRPRFGLKGAVKSVTLVTFYAKGKEKDWKKDKNRKGSKRTEFGENGNLLKSEFFGKDGQLQRTRTNVGTIWGKRPEGTAVFTDKNSADSVVEVTKKRRKSPTTYAFETLNPNGVVLIRGEVITDENGKILVQTYVRLNANGSTKNTVKRTITYDAYGFIGTEIVTDETGKQVSFFRYEYVGFDDFGNWTERMVYDSPEEKTPVRIEMREFTTY